MYVLCCTVVRIMSNKSNIYVNLHDRQSSSCCVLCKWLGYIYCSVVLTCWSMETLIWDMSRMGRPVGQTASVSITNVSPSSSSTLAPAPAPRTRPSALDTGYTLTHHSAFFRVMILILYNPPGVTFLISDVRRYSDPALDLPILSNL